MSPTSTLWPSTKGSVRPLPRMPATKASDGARREQRSIRQSARIPWRHHNMTLCCWAYKSERSDSFDAVAFTYSPIQLC